MDIAITLTFDLMTLNVCIALAGTWPNPVPNFKRIEKSAKAFIRPKVQQICLPAKPIQDNSWVAYNAIPNTLT